MEHKNNKELAVDLVVAMLEHNSKLKHHNSQNIASFIQPSHITDSLTTFYNKLEKLDQTTFESDN